MIRIRVYGGLTMDLQEPSKLLIYLVSGQTGKQDYTNTNQYKYIRITLWDTKKLTHEWEY
jgi:hypothetical protein